MLDLEERNRARKKAMRLLEHMDRTEKGLTDKLRQAEFSQEAVEDAIAYVKSYGYINDAVMPEPISPSAWKPGAVRKSSRNFS